LVKRVDIRGLRWLQCRLGRRSRQLEVVDYLKDGMRMVIDG
jgi:hypothetical protein